MSTSDKEAAADSQKRSGLLSPLKIPVKNEEHEGKLRVLSELLGQELTQWEFSEETLAAMLTLRTEQERSRQLEVKQNTLQLSLELIALARSTGIPPQFIPMLFPSHMDETTREALETARAEFDPPRPRSQQITQQQPPPPQQQRYEFHHWPGPPEEEEQAKRRHPSNRRNSIHHRTYSEFPPQQHQQIPPLPPHLQQYRYQYSSAAPLYGPQPVHYPPPPPPPQQYPYAIQVPQRRDSWDSPKREGPPTWVPQPPPTQERNSPSTLTPTRSSKQNVSFMISTPQNPPK